MTATGALMLSVLAVASGVALRRFADRPSEPREEPCQRCAHPFDQDKLGPLGCPNCEGEGLS